MRVVLFSRSQVTSIRVFAAFCMALGLFNSGGVQAVTYTFTPSNSTGTLTWSSGTSWTATPVSGATTELTFRDATGTTAFTNTTSLSNTSSNNIDGTFQLNILNLGGLGSATSARARTIAISNASPATGLSFVSNGGTTPVINLVANDGTGTSVVTYNVSTSLALTNNTLFTGNGTGTFNFSGVISGAGNLTKTGASTLTLGGANTFTGGVIFTGAADENIGNIRLSSSTALGTAASIKTINMSASTGNAVGAIELTNNITVAGKHLQLGGRTVAAANAALRNVSGTNAWNGNIAITNAGVGGHVIETASGSTLNLGGTINSSISGAVLTFLGDGTTSLRGTIQNGTGTLGLDKQGTGVMTITGTSTYTGGTAVNGGIVTFEDVAALSGGMSGGGSVAVANGAGVGFGIAASQFTSAQINTLRNAVVFAGNGVVGLDTGTSNLTYNAALTDNTAGTQTGFAKLGSGILTINRTDNTYTGETRVLGGVLQFAKAASLSSGTTTTSEFVVSSGATAAFNIGGVDEFTSADLDQFLGQASATGGFQSGSYIGLDTTNAAGGTFTYSGVIGNATPAANAYGLAKRGAGTLVFSGANLYAGGTHILQGTVQVEAGSSLGAAAGSLILGTGTAGAVGTVGNLTLKTNTSVGAINIRSNTATLTGADMGQLNILSGTTLTATSLTMGVTSSDAAGTNTALGTGSTPGGGGTFTVNGNIAIGQGGASDSATNANTLLDLSGLSSFNQTSTASTGYLRVGYGTRNFGTLTLATNNNINVNTISIGDTNTLNGALSAVTTMNLGTGTNVLYANTFDIGRSKGPALVQFGGATGTVVIAGTNGVGNTDISISIHENGTYSSGSLLSGLLLAGHDADVNADEVIIGQKAGGAGGVVTAALTFDTGTFDATNIRLAGLNTTGTNVVTSTFTVGGETANSAATGIVNVTNNVVLGFNAAATQASSATMTVNGGTVNVNTAGLAAGGILSTNVSTGAVSTLTLAGGTLNLNGGVIGQNGVAGNVAITNLNFDSGTLKNVKQINNGASISKTTEGTMILDGTNTYTGGTTVAAGKFFVNGTHTTAGSYTVTASGTTLGGSGSITGASAASITLGANSFLVVGSNHGAVAGNTAAQDFALTTSGGGDINLGGGTLQFDLFRSDAGVPTAESDLLILNAAAANDLILNGKIELALGMGLPADFTGWQAGDRWRLIDWSAVTGVVDASALTLSTTELNGFSFTADIQNDGFYIIASAVPEPSRVLLVLVGVVGLLVRRRR